MTLRPLAGEQMPTLIEKSRIAIEQEYDSLNPRIRQILKNSATGGPADLDAHAGRRAVDHRHRTSLRRLSGSGQDQARLIYSSGVDHLCTLGRVLGSDGRVSLFAHTTLARSVAEAAVRVCWLLDASVDYEQRVLRSAACGHNNVTNQAKAAREIPEQGHHLSGKRKEFVAACEKMVTKVEKIITSAGIVIETNTKAKPEPVRLRLGAHKESLRFETGPKMKALFPAFPPLYTMTSGIAHSLPWMLDVSRTRESGPELELEIDLMQVGAAATASIFASSLMVKTYATFYGVDPEPYVRPSRQRIAMLETWMRAHAAELESPHQMQAAGK